MLETLKYNWSFNNIFFSVLHMQLTFATRFKEVIKSDFKILNKNVFYLAKIRLLTFCVLFLMTTVQAQNDAPPVYVAEGTVVANCNRLDVAESKTVTINAGFETIYVQKGTLITGREQIINHIVVFEKSKQQVQSPLPTEHDAIAEVIEPNTIFNALPFGKPQAINLYLLADAVIISVTNSICYQKEVAVFSVSLNRYSSIGLQREKVSQLDYDPQLSPLEKFNRFFSLPPPEKCI